MDIRKTVDEAAKVLQNGGVILYPTDTVWALGCDATNRQAVEKVLTIRAREQGKSLIILVNSVDMVYRYVESVPEIAPQLIEIADQPLTIVYPKAVGLAPNVPAEDGSIGIRVVNHRFCNMLLSKFKRPIISVCATLSAEKPPVRLEDISPKIVKMADWCATSDLDEGATGKSSSMIMLGEGGVVKILT